jgi:hypothetical protein
MLCEASVFSRQPNLWRYGLFYQSRRDAMKQILVDFNSVNSEPLDLVMLGPTDRLSVPLEDGDLV